MFAVVYIQFVGLDVPYSVTILVLSVLLDLSFLSHKRWVQENSDKIIADYSEGQRPKEIFRREIEVFYFLIIALMVFAISTRFLFPKFEAEISSLFGDLVGFTKFALGLCALIASGLVFLYQAELVQELPGIGNRFDLGRRDSLRDRWQNDTRLVVNGIAGMLGIVILLLVPLSGMLTYPRWSGTIPPEIIPILASLMIALVFGDVACVLRGFDKLKVADSPNKTT